MRASSTLASTAFVVGRSTAAVTVLVYKKGGKISKSFAFKDTKAATEKAKEIAAAAEEALK